MQVEAYQLVLAFAAGCLLTFWLMYNPEPMSKESRKDEAALKSIATEPTEAPKRKRGRPRKVA